MSKDKFLFSVSVMSTIDGRGLGASKPDEYGYYRYPVAVINTATENKTFYDPNDLKDQINNPNNIFRIKLERGALYGEDKHPELEMTADSKERDIKRLLDIDSDRLSHHIREVFTTDHPTIKDAYIIWAYIKPMLPKGPALKEKLESEFVNAAFSLRSLVRERYDAAKDLLVRNIIQLVTFDAVLMPGSPEASKRFSNVGVESYSKEITSDVFQQLATNNNIAFAGMEASDDNTLRNMLSQAEVKIHTQNKELVGFRDEGEAFVRGTLGSKQSLVHLGLTSKGGI